MMRQCALGWILGLALWLPGATALAQPDQVTPEEIRALRQRILELEQKVRQLEARPAPGATNESASRIEQLDRRVAELRQQWEDEEAAAALRARNTPFLRIGEDGFMFSSANSNFVMQFKALLQIDSRTFFGEDLIDGDDGFLLRRARPILQGTVYKDFDFYFAPDFGGTLDPFIADAYVNYRYRPELQLRAGRYKVPVGLELLQSDRDTHFNERAFPTALVPIRDLGIMLHGDVWEDRLTYAAGIFNGVGDGRSTENADINDRKSLVGRLFLHPFATADHALKALGIGVGANWEDLEDPDVEGLPGLTGGLLPGYSTPAQQQLFAYNPAWGRVAAEGTHWRLAPQANYFVGPLSLLFEYTASDQEVVLLGANPANTRLQQSAWQFSTGWVLTGEPARFTGVKPKRPFSPAQGQWGALQLVGRYAEISVDPHAFPTFSDPGTSATGAQEIAFGLNWFLNNNLRMNASFSHVHFDGAGQLSLFAPGAVTVNDENVLMTRVQLSF